MSLRELEPNGSKPPMFIRQTILWGAGALAPQTLTAGDKHMPPQTLTADDKIPDLGYSIEVHH